MKRYAYQGPYRVLPQRHLNFNGLVVDMFAGGGGASTGIEQAIGRPVDIAINHDPDAVRMHEVNHPQTLHLCESVWEVNPRELVAGRHVELLWASPDCKHFSKAKGGKPREKKIRGLAWSVLRWASLPPEQGKPAVIALENVEEFKDWGPLLANGQPCPKQKGRTFQTFVNALRRQGYQVEWKELRACDYGAPTIRKRLFLVARCDGKPICWPVPTNGTGRIPYRTAAECIDWSVPCPSIFERKKPLAEATLRRIARGLQRFVVENPRPFIVPIAHYNGRDLVHSIDEPLRTITANPKGGAFALVTAFLAKHYGGNYTGPGASLNAPMPTVTTTDHSALVMAFLIKYYSEGGQWQGLTEPMHTIPTRDRIGLVTVHGEPYRIVDIGMRMLEPRELFRAQGFPDDYVISHDGHGRKFSKAAQVARCGNSVSPPIAAAIIQANFQQTVSIEVAA